MMERWLREPLDELERFLSIAGAWPSRVVLLRFMTIGFGLCGSEEAMLRAGWFDYDGAYPIGCDVRLELGVVLIMPPSRAGLWREYYEIPQWCCLEVVSVDVECSG